MLARPKLWQNEHKNKTGRYLLGKGEQLYIWTSTNAIRLRIAQARDLTFSLRVRLLRCYVISLLIHGIEVWPLNNIEMKKLEAYEMRCCKDIIDG